MRHVTKYANALLQKELVKFPKLWRTIFVSQTAPRRDNFNFIKLCVQFPRCHLGHICALWQQISSSCMLPLSFRVLTRAAFLFTHLIDLSDFYFLSVSTDILTSDEPSGPISVSPDKHQSNPLILFRNQTPSCSRWACSRKCFSAFMCSCGK